MTTVYMKQGDRLPALRMQLKDSTGTPIDLTGVTSVTFRMRDSSGSLVTLTGTATVVTAATGHVQYAWGVGDTATVGGYSAEWACDFSGSVLTVPTRDYVTVQVVDALGA